jgi:hypothetical protein
MPLFLLPWWLRRGEGERSECRVEAEASAPSQTMSGNVEAEASASISNGVTLSLSCRGEASTCISNGVTLSRCHVEAKASTSISVALRCIAVMLAPSAAPAPLRSLRLRSGQAGQED